MLLVSCKQYIEAINFLSRTNYKEVSYFFLNISIKNKMVSVRKQTDTQNPKEPLLNEDVFLKIDKYYDN